MLSKMRILLIDDSRAIHAFVKEAVSALKYDIVSVYDGQEGIDLLQKDKQFNFILLDWEMPVLDGPSTLKKIMENQWDIPVSMMTSKSSFEDIRRMISLGAKEYIMKPFTRDILLEKMETMASCRKVS